MTNVTSLLVLKMSCTSSSTCRRRRCDWQVKVSWLKHYLIKEVGNANMQYANMTRLISFTLFSSFASNYCLYIWFFLRATPAPNWIGAPGKIPVVPMAHPAPDWNNPQIISIEFSSNFVIQFCKYDFAAEIKFIHNLIIFEQFDNRDWICRWFFI